MEIHKIFLLFFYFKVRWHYNLIHGITLWPKLKWTKLQPCNLEHSAIDQYKWHNLYSKVTNNFQANWHIQHLKASQKRQWKMSAPAPIVNVSCPTCKFICASDFGFRSYLNAHSHGLHIVFIFLTHYHYITH